ncbi:hypothetical protein AQI95_36000 [Streptomyces yokosukanensis]|uniref:Uncharacterized protein n=1 Tax=Streptomyces yokosukanensis TaxID=67386 RepID=A0A117PZ22_9ACTN|nr:hypothetical protein [Streptomyces yokosukanensis]KUM99920.1 hypothetical protein AQI95_36000 [Streptomyces yokosukanensis]
MHQIDLKAEVARLRQLGSDFQDAHSTARSLTLSPGTDALRQLVPQITAVNGLAGQAMERLAALDGSQYTAVPGSRPALELLASVVYSASIASCDLSAALEANPLEGAAFPGPPADDDAVRAARHKEAAPVMAGHLADAIHQLDLAYTGCYYLASGITRDMEQHAERSQTVATPKITDSQAAVLARLSTGGGALYQSLRRGSQSASDNVGASINLATLNALIKRGLVTVDATTPQLVGQRLEATAEGRRALAQHKPAKVSARAPSAVPLAAQQPAGHRR